MRVTRGWWLGTGAAVLTAGVIVLANGFGNAQRTLPPKARYYVDATTASGLPDMNVMALLKKRRGGGGARHELELRLGSKQAPNDGAARADHFMPAGMALGASVPLITPVVAGSTATGERDRPPAGVRRPTGRLLLYWGCGAHVTAGQPVVIDFAKVAAGQFPPNLFSVAVAVDRGPTPATSRTYGSWPTDADRKPLPATSSLLGQHRVAGNYAPEIAFALSQDFMPALQPTSGAAPGGGLSYGWNAVAGATGYYAWAVGTLGNGDMVWWSSSARQEFGGGLWDFPAPATVARLVSQRVVLPPTQTSCDVPAEVVQAAGPMLVGFLYAYGPQLDFAYPPRPANPRATWAPDWIAKVRYRSTAMLLPALGAMTGAAARGDDDAPARKRTCKPKLGSLVSGMFGRKPSLAGVAGSAADAATDCR